MSRSWRRAAAFFVCLIAVMAQSCSLLPGDATPASTATPARLAQWAAGATASSHYARPDWSPNRANGAPEITVCADDARAWASARGGGVEWIELTYTRQVIATEIAIHQTFGRGAVSRVTILDDAGNREVVWEGTDDREPCPGVLRVRVPPTAMRAGTVRIDLDESRTGTWNQIDAVELVGTP